jgi:excisionase family DNA binding protein
VAAHATLLESCAEELESALQQQHDELLSIKEAAVESGYSEETLRRKARNGKLPAERSSGKKSHLKLRRGDLPTKPIRRNAASSSHIPYNPEEDARDIAQRLGGNYA